MKGSELYRIRKLAGVATEQDLCREMAEKEKPRKALTSETIQGWAKEIAASGDVDKALTELLAALKNEGINI